MKQFNLETQAWEGEDDPPITSLQYLQSIYRDENRPDNMRIRCAVEALPYENPKLSATANIHYDGTFAVQLEKCIERSQGAVPRLNGPVPELPASELKKPMSRYRRF